MQRLITPDFAIKTLHDFLSPAIAYLQGKNPEEAELMSRRYQLTLKVLSPLKDTHPALYYMISALVYYHAFQVLKENRLFNLYIEDIDALSKCIIYSSPKYLEKSLLHCNYILAALGIAMESVVQSFQINRQVYELNLLGNIREALIRLMKARGQKDDLIANTAEMMLSSLYYIYPFSGIEAEWLSGQQKAFKRKFKKNEWKIMETDMSKFLDRNQFETRGDNYFSSWAKKKARSSDDDCLMYWLQLYLCNIYFKHEKILQAKAGREVIIALPALEIMREEGIDELLKFLTSLAEMGKIGDFYLVPGYEMGMNLYDGLMCQLNIFTKEALERLNAGIKKIDCEEVIPDCSHLLWNELFLQLRLKLKVLAMGYEFLSISSPRVSLAILDIEIRKMSIVYDWENTEGLIKRMQAVKEAHKKNGDNLLKEVPVAKERKYKSRYCRSSQPLIFRPEKTEEEGEEKSVSIKPSIEEQISTLIDKKFFFKAFKLGDELRLKASNENDKAKLAKAYCYLGDIYKALSGYQDGALKESNFNKAKENYLSCIDVIGQIQDADSELINSRDLLKHLLKEEFDYSPLENKPEKDIPFITADIHYPGYVQDVFNELSEFDSYLVGGAVRDYPLAVNDYDIVTTASMEEISKKFAGKGKMVGSKFPVFLIESEGKKAIQISRMTSQTDFSRREVVSLENKMIVCINPTDNILEDAAKRDLSCNSLYYDWKNKKIIDPCNGIKDVKDRKIRFICNPSEKLRNEPDQIFKLIRLIARKDYVLENEAVLIGHLHYLNRLNVSKLNQEICKTLLDYNCMEKALALFAKYHLLACVYGFTENDEEVLIKRIREVLNHPQYKDDRRSQYLLLACTICECLDIGKMKFSGHTLESFSELLKVQGFYDSSMNIARILMIYLGDTKNMTVLGEDLALINVLIRSGEKFKLTPPLIMQSFFAHKHKRDLVSASSQKQCMLK